MQRGQETERVSEGTRFSIGQVEQVRQTRGVEMERRGRRFLEPSRLTFRRCHSSVIALQELCQGFDKLEVGFLGCVNEGDKAREDLD